MMALDVNVLVYAHREDVKDHRVYRDWLESVINSNTAYGFSELVLPSSTLFSCQTHIQGLGRNKNKELVRRWKFCVVTRIA